MKGLSNILLITSGKIGIGGLITGRRLRREDDEKEKSGFSYLSFDSSFDNLTTETGREVKTATVA